MIIKNKNIKLISGNKNKFFLLGLGIIFFVVLINIFPKGYVFGGGDTAQFINAKENIRNFFFNKNTSGFIYYLLFSTIDLLGISNSIQLSFYLGFILFGAYLSFWIFSKLIFPKTTDLQKTLISLFYALNLYTLFLFTGNWGYSYFPCLYIFIPILIGLFIKFLKNKKYIYGIWFSLVLFLGSSGFGNVAFALSFVLFLFFITILLWVFKFIEIKGEIFKKLILIATLSFLVSAFWIFPVIPQLQSGVERIASSNVVDFDSWMRSTSSPMDFSFSLLHYSEKHFPLNFYYRNFKFFQPIFIFLAFLPIILIISFFIFSEKITRNKKLLFFSFLGLLLIFIMLVARFRFPFEKINYYIYSIWGFNTLRGYDKTAIYIPFIFSVLLLIGLMNFQNKKLAYILIIISLLAPLPFYIGKIQQTAGYRVNSKKDYQKAKMSFLVKIPEDYYKIRDRINSDKEKSFIATLPATYNDGSGVIYFKKWEFYGDDITRNLYNKNFIEANRNYFENWKYADDFSDREEIKNNDWLIELLGMMNARYIIYHKDAPESSVEKTLSKMKDLESRGLIKNLEENDYFILYQISDNYFMPYITWQNGNFEIQGDVDSVERNFEKVKSNSFMADFSEINPKKFVVDLNNKKVGENLILAEKYSSLWKAYTINENGKEIEIKNHFKARGYANGWKIENPQNISKIIIEYYPIRLMWRGIWISGITVLFLIGYLLKYYYVKRKMV